MPQITQINIVETNLDEYRFAHRYRRISEIHEFASVYLLE